MVGMVAEGHLPIGLSHLFVGGRAGDAEGAIGFLKGDINVWLPLLLLLLVVGEVVGGAMPVGEMEGGTPVHGVDEPAKEESPKESSATAYAVADDAEYPFIA